MVMEVEVWARSVTAKGRISCGAHFTLARRSWFEM